MQIRFFGVERKEASIKYSIIIIWIALFSSRRYSMLLDNQKSALRACVCFFSLSHHLIHAFNSCENPWRLNVFKMLCCLHLIMLLMNDFSLIASLWKTPKAQKRKKIYPQCIVSLPEISSYLVDGALFIPPVSYRPSILQNSSMDFLQMLCM